MGTLNPTDAAFELQRWHPELHISPELAIWLLGCSGEELLLAANGAVPFDRLDKIMQHARHPERGPGDLQARVLHGLAIGATRIQIRGSDHIPFGSRELVMVTRLRRQDQRLPIDWIGGKDHGFVSLEGGRDEPNTELPKTWREYFDRNRAAKDSERAAEDRFSEAGASLRTASDRVAELEAWAKATDKTHSYTGAGMADDPIPRPSSLPVFPDIGCHGDCVFKRRGVGWQCVDGPACGRYVHPGDEHFDALETYHRVMMATE